MSTTYYLIRREYVGPNAADDRYIDATTIEIRTEPARFNGSGAVCVYGWGGTTNDWATYADGEYATLDEAKAAVATKFGLVRNRTPDGDTLESDDEDVVEVCKPGLYAPATRDHTLEWCINSQVAGNMTDAELDAMAAEITDALATEGYTPHADLRDILTKLRDDKAAD